MGSVCGGATGDAGWGVGHGRYWVYGIMESVLLPWTIAGWEGQDESMVARKPSPSTLHNTIVLQVVHSMATTSFAQHEVVTCTFLLRAGIALNHNLSNCTCLRDDQTNTIHHTFRKQSSMLFIEKHNLQQHDNTNNHNNNADKTLKQRKCIDDP